MDLTGAIIDYENGDLSAEGTLELFGELVSNGMAWSLQGHYGRTAARLLSAGLIDESGAVNWDRFDDLKREGLL